MLPQNMAIQATIDASHSTRKERMEPVFSEARAWESVSGSWRQLDGSFHESGYSVEWHDFTIERDLDWSRSFHPGGVEICLNLTGCGEVRAGRRTLRLEPFTAGFYFQDHARLKASRRGGERHQFVTIELSKAFLELHISPESPGLHPCLNTLCARGKCAAAAVSEPTKLSNGHQEMIMSLRLPPVCAAAQRTWYQAKVLEAAAALFYRPAPHEELFCQRQKRLNQERVQKVITLLKENLAEPPALEEIGQRVGCSHYYLSRIFTQEMGKTISAYLRDLRMERAANLLREGRLNVTEVALSVGYSSSSHFSAAFHETFGCCPGLYPLATCSHRTARFQC